MREQKMRPSRIAIIILVTTFVTALPAQAELPPDPGVAGEATIEGIDTNGNGIRDDLEIAIYNAYPDNAGAANILTRMAGFYQSILLDNLNKTGVLDSFGYLAALSPCLVSAGGSTSAINETLRPQVLNTYDRSIAYITALETMANVTLLPVKTVNCSVLPPGIPGPMVVPEISTTYTFTISWGMSSGTVTRYVFQHDTNSNFSAPQTGGNGTATSLSGEYRNGTYYWRVKACNGVNNDVCSAWRTATNSLTIMQPPPNTPSSVTVPASSSTGDYRVSWVSTERTHYNMEEATSASFTDAKVVYSNLYGTPLYADFTNKPNGTYYYRVRVCDIYQCSGYTAGANGIVVNVPVPSVPALYVPANFVKTEPYVVSWGAVSERVDFYQLQEKLILKYDGLTWHGGEWYTVYTGKNLTTTIAAKGNVLYQYRYWYKVKACNYRGCSAWSPTSYTTKTN
jgi:hypothetical protein